MSVENVSPIYFKGISNVTAVPDVDIGTERTVAGEKYVYVYNCGGSTAGVRLGMTRPVSAYAGLYSCSASSISGDMPIGFVKHVAIPAGEYGWLLTRGLVSCSVASSASDQAAGPKALGPLGVIATLGAGYAVIGELTTIVVSGNTGTLFVNLP